MTDNKTLREQVAGAIADNLNCTLPDIDDVGFVVTITNIDKAADAAIQAVLEGMRCRTCKWWLEPPNRPYPIWECHKETEEGRDYLRIDTCGPYHGCIRWEQKQ